MEVYVKESLHVLDYDNNIVDTIFTSDDKRTPGYAHDITIKEENTGYSDLSFAMPNTIFTSQGEEIKNPKLALLTPLVKLRYRREVYYTGDKPIKVREPEGYGDTVTYIDKTYSNVYPENLIEDYIMDYIVQPVDKKRDVLKLSTMFTAIDYPRFTLSKKRVGLNINDDIITKKEWSLFNNKPLDKPGTIKYQPWTKAMSTSFQVGSNIIPTEWDPEHATEYPLTKENIRKLMGDTAQWPYGLLATAFYWPITSTGRFNGVLYKKGGFLVLQLYDFYYLSTEGVDPDLYIDRYAWDWTQLYEIQSYLCPNNALNYLQYILDGTNWAVALKDGSRPDPNKTYTRDDYAVDIVQSEISNPKGSTTSTTLADDTCNISVSNSNCYNAITSVCKGLQLYPVFDCINRTVSLRMFAGKNYGLVYSLGQNLLNDSTKADGEKVITKLYVDGGKDYNGDADINIGTAERTYRERFAGFYKTLSSAPTVDVTGYWIVVDSNFNDNDFNSLEYNQDMTPKTVEVHDTRVTNYWNMGPNRAVYFWNNTTGQWVLGIKEESGNWSGKVNDVEYIIDPQTGMIAPWDPNDDAYIMSRSPYGTNYILNLRWAYQNNWITKEQILHLYQLELKIHHLDYMFMDKYTEDRRKTQQAYNTAVNNYDIAQDGFQSTLNAMMSKYYNDEEDVSKGTTYCFHKAPQGTYIKRNDALDKDTRWIKIFHCYKCGITEAIAPNGTSAGNNKTACSCGSTDVANEEIYIPVYSDFSGLAGNNIHFPYGTDVSRTYEGAEYNPHLKGYYLRLVMGLDRANGDWSISDYEDRVSMITPIEHKEGTATIDGFDYIISHVYVRATSGQIEVWNDSIAQYISSYGKMLDYLREVNGNLQRIKELEELYKKFMDTRNQYHTDIQNLFGDYLVEGTYNNDEQPYVGLLFKEGLEASDKFSVPKITYTLNVIDATGLAEYRTPMITKYECASCGHISYTPVVACARCGHESILTIHDTYNDLVHMLHSVGQIVPKAGDYTTIYDEPMGMFGVPALITEVQRVLDDPCKNTIKLDTSYTDDEELVGNIITATNTVLSNADIYARTAILKGDGTIDGAAIKNSLDSPFADISIVGTNGSILLNGSGLRCTDPTDPHRAMKYAGNGVFSTTNLDNDVGEAVVWEKMMTPSGINATYIRSGSIDTNKITIMSGLSGKVILDQNGLAVKNDVSKVHHITTFDTVAAKKDASYAKDWGTTNNINAFIGVDNNNRSLIYTKGFLYAEEGSNIANWITSNDGFYHLTGTTKDLWLSPNGTLKGTVSGNNVTSGEKNFLIFAKNKFGVTTDGTLYASNANLAGYIYITDSNSNMNTGTIAGWTSTGNGLKNTNNNATLVLSPAGGAITGAVHDSGSRSDWGIFMNSKFGVTTGGDVYMTGAHVKGDIYADSGTFNGTIEAKNGHIGGWTIEADKLSGSGIISGGSISGSSITCGNTFSVTSGGTIKATKGTIGGWSINSSGIYHYRGEELASYVFADGRIQIKPEDGGRLNVGNNGILLQGAGTGNKVLISDSAGDLDSYPNATGTINMVAQNGTIRLACNDQISILAGRRNTTTADAADGQAYIVGTRFGESGDGHNKDSSGIELYTPKASTRINADRNAWIRAGGSIILEAEGKGIYIGDGTNTGGHSAGEISIGNQTSGTVKIKGVLQSGYTPSSSRNIKENINPIKQNELDELYDKIKDLDFYTYNYKKGYGDDKGILHRGFIIEEMENTIVNEYLHFITNDEDSNIKYFDAHELGKMDLILIHILQQRIEKLEQELKQIKRED